MIDVITALIIWAVAGYAFAVWAANGDTYPPRNRRKAFLLSVLAGPLFWFFFIIVYFYFHAKNFRDWLYK